MGSIRKIPEFWRRRSLKFWLATGMLMSIVPIFVSAVSGYLLYHQTIIQPLVDVASKQRTILQPLQNVQLSLWDVSKSVVDIAIDGEARHKLVYEQEARQIEGGFASLVTAMKAQGLEVSNVNEAQDYWRELSMLSNTILSGDYLHGDAAVGENVEAFEALIGRLGHQLGTVHDAVRIKNEQTHDQALASLTGSERLVVVGLAISILGAMLGVVVINHSLVSSMDQLADGALRLAGGDCEHPIEVQIPRELTNVADAFNLMTKQINEQKHALEHTARTDGLTGLYNRREFDRMLAEEISRAERYGRPVSLVMGDIDHFKSFNDAHGHQAGDEALRAVAQTLKENLRDVDKAFRFGGEEFAVILPECDAQAARQAAERMRAAVKTIVVLVDGEQTAKMTISFGVGTSPGNGATPETLLKSADSAMYQSKQAGRDRVMAAV